MGGKAGETRDSPIRDYLLVVGPGRSGSTFLYRLVNRHASFCAPQIKEGHYYRSLKRFEKALRKIRGNASSILLDVANLAWKDAALARGVKALSEQDYRVLVVVLLRNHHDRAVSIARYRRSRAVPSLILGPRALERAILRNSLTPERLSGILSLGTDVLVVEFDTLVDHTAEVLRHLARLCGTADFEAAAIGPVNPTMESRSTVLSLLGRLAAKALRRIGLRRLLQRLKDSPQVMRLFFRPAAAVDDGLEFDPETEVRLADLFSTCRHTVEQAGERLAEGLWLVPAKAESASRHSP